MKYLLFNVGCIECGVTSNVVGVFESEAEAIELARKLNDDDKFSFREGGQNGYEVFSLPEGCFVNGEYKLTPQTGDE